MSETANANWTPPTITRELTWGPITIDRIEPEHGGRFYGWKLDFGGGFARTCHAITLLDALDAVCDEAGLGSDD